MPCSAIHFLVSDLHVYSCNTYASLYAREMAFRKKTVEFLQKERAELPARRPAIIYLVCPTHSLDFQQQTLLYSQFERAQSLPEGISTREGNPYNTCLVEAHPEPAQLEEQLQAALEEYNEACYKVLVINGYGCPEGILVGKGTEGESGRVILSGRSVAKLASRHYHGCNFHTVCLTAYGHKFADDFTSGIITAACDDKEMRKLFAVTYFTSEAVPHAWQRAATVGEAHTELKRDISDFLSKHVQPNSPYKIIDAQMAKTASCHLL